MIQETTRTKISDLIKGLGNNLVALSEILLENSFQQQETEHHDGEDKKNKRKKKAEKDPNAPKRNLSSYMLYSQAVRPKTVQEHPDLKAVDIAKLIGEKWNALSDKEKQPYIKQAEKEKARFEKENNTYLHTLGIEPKPSHKRKVLVDEPEPKKKSKKEDFSSSAITEVVSNKKKSFHKKKN